VLAVVDHGTYNGKMRLELCLFVENEQMAWCEPCRDVVNGKSVDWADWLVVMASAECNGTDRLLKFRYHFWSGHKIVFRRMM